MLDSEKRAVEEIKAVVAQHDPGAQVIVVAREYAQAQPICDTTVAVVTRVNHFELIDALIDFCVASEGTYRLSRTQVDAASSADVDVYEITMKIYKRI